jgi:hemerythrin-like domain-containing protein
MQSLELLIDEHTIIERVLLLMQHAAERLEQDQPIPRGFRRWAIRFVREFADGSHHRKEEDVLFPLLEERGIPRESGPIGCMLNEHEVGRDCVRRMEASIASRPRDNAAYVAAVKEYVALLRQHIFKENNILFQMARQCLEPGDDARVVAAYRTAESSEEADATQRLVIHDIERWESEFGVRVCTP